MTESAAESCCDVSRIDTTRIETILQSGMLKTCHAELDDFLDEIGFRELRSLMLRLYVSMDIYIAARSFSRELGIGNDLFVEQFGSIDEISSRLQTLDSTTSFFHALTEQCIRWRMDAAAESPGNIIKKAKDYIDRHFTEEDLSLSTVAEQVGLSPPYLSTAFKREIKMNFCDYLTKVRIRRAKELLCCTSKMVYEIAGEVGFRDYRYFSQIFKKHTGLTPREYQRTANRQQTVS